MLRTALVSLVLAAPLAIALPLAIQKDPSTIVPDATMIAQTHRELSAAKVGLAEAAAAVAKETGGLVSRIESRVQDGRPVWEASAWSAEKSWRCTVDGATGAVTKHELPAYTFPGAPVASEWVTTASGLRYVDLAKGTGPTPKSARSQVKVHYTGWLLDGTKFDSSVDRNEPAVFPLNGVIPGWTEGVGSMQVGGKRKLLLPANLGYGDRSMGRIPAKATLVFDVELIAVVAD